MLLATPVVPDNAPLAHHACRNSGRIVWQQRYDGIAHVAYRGGKAIAGVSGPWSDRYALIWWDERPPGANTLELFETAAAAMRAVEDHAGRSMPEALAPGEPGCRAHRGWWAGLWERRSKRRIAQLRRRCLNADADLNGLNFCASR